MTTSTLDTALSLSAAGWVIFPCYPRGSGHDPAGKPYDKRPLVAGWQNLTSADSQAQCRSWWNQWPHAIIGVQCGQRTGIWVVDIDVRLEEHKDGYAELAKRGYALPDTLTHHTSRGGCHKIYRTVPGEYCVTNNNAVAPGVDLKGDGGYIIWWPAHGGAVTPGDIAPAPAWMMNYTGADGDSEGEAKLPLGLDDDAIDELLAMVPPASMGDRGPWIRLGMALHHETGGDLYGLQVWTDWSSRWPKYDGPENCEREWNTFGRGRRAAVTMRSYIPRGWSPGRPTASQAFAPPVSAGAPPVAPVPAAPPAQATPAAITGETLLLPAAQVGYFAGCIYIAGLHRVMAPDGQMYDQQRFNAVYGGRSFVMDATNARTVRSAWECFLESQAIAFPKVDGCMFRPERPSGAVITLEGRRYVNMYSPIETRKVDGDPEPFLRLMTKMLPDARDRDILLTYMASMLRNPGMKFQWWPVLQGAEGNGKTAFIRLMQHCVGKRYSHLPNTGEMAKNGIKFNAWIVACLFLGFEEIYVPGRREFLEELKPVVTNDSLQVERKGVDQTMEDNRANGLMCTNHEDGVPVTTDTRRYAIFYTAQQRAADKLRDGMTGDYFRDFYDWCYGRGVYAAGGENYGFSVMNWWLRTQYILKAEFDPAGACQVAPRTSSSDAAIRASLGPVEQEILEAIEAEQQGFRGGWISSVALDRLMENTGKRIARNQRRRILQTLGYDWHPHLRDGRTTHGTLIDGGGKFRLYIKAAHSDRVLTDSKAIVDKYVADQQ